MWKINRLYLKNFLNIYAGMHKREIELDLHNTNKKINILIGKMGSGKSSILGHLQPFSTYGTLDIRNQESLIIPGEDGLKEIEYLHNGDIYTIQHKYTWNKNGETHSTKSFIQLNGVELNENGNVKSFKEIIRDHFGIDQNFLRLLRLGPNVANLINMKSTERKSFIASLLKDSEIYTLLHQKLSEDYRSMNGTLNMLSNKLVNLSSDKEKELMCELDDLESDINDNLKDIDSFKSKIAKMEGTNITLANKKPLNDLVLESSTIEESINKKMKELDELKDIVANIPNTSVENLSVKYGEMYLKLNLTKENILNLQSEYKEITANLQKIKDFILLQNNDGQLSLLASKADNIKKQYELSMKKLEGFECNYSYSYLVGLPSLIDNLQMNLEEMSMNKREVIGKLYNSDSSVISWAKKKLSILTGKEINLQKLLSNIKFSKDYESPIPLYRPPCCPTIDCPFIQTHPQIIKEYSKDPRNDSIIKLKDEIDALEVEKAIYEDYITQYPKMQILKKMWESLSFTLRTLGVLKEHNLYRILISLDSRCDWYDYDKLIAITEKEKMKEDFSQLQNEYYKVENEILSLKNSDIEKKKQEADEYEKRCNDILLNIESENKKYIELDKEVNEINELLTNIKNIEVHQSRINNLENDLNVLNGKLIDIQDRISQISDNLQNIKILEAKLASLNMIYTENNTKAMNIRMRLQDIKSTKSSYNEYIAERNMLKLILDAVSSKDGIPLIMVKVFLDECKEIINDLISDIFDDDLEIVDFNISETTNDFKIPYRVNGNEVADIELASQGQQAVISIALSFALCRKSMFDYNIMLLDEIDNSIYKSDREKFIMILGKQMQALGTEQVFLITHNDIFQQSGLPVNIIMTTNEIVDSYPNQSIIQLF